MPPVASVKRPARLTKANAEKPVHPTIRRNNQALERTVVRIQVSRVAAFITPLLLQAADHVFKDLRESVSGCYSKAVALS